MNWKEKHSMTTNYWDTYNYLLSNLPVEKFFEFRYDCKIGFLYQEPNPNYYKWKIENCKFILFEDWIPQYLPEGFICRIQWGGRNNVHGIIKPRPVLCVETGEFFPSAEHANRAYKIRGSVNRCCRGTSSVFVWGEDDTPYRFTYIDPFIPGDQKLPFQSYIYEREAARRIAREGYLFSKQHWYNNGVNETKAVEPPGEEWHAGRIKGKHYNQPKNKKKPTKRGWEW